MIKKMKVFSNSFGKNDKFSIGDVVRWSDLSKKFIGIINDVHLEEEGGRDVAWATVYVYADEERRKILCLNLEKINISPINSMEN